MRVLTIVGARPQFIKASVVSRQLKLNSIEELVLHTGQHFDSNMSEIFFEQLDIPRPAINLDIRESSHAQMTGQMLQEIESVIAEKKPDRVLVYGDTNSTLAGALAAAKVHVPVSHIEAGLRSFNMKMPEEVNRILTDQISDQLFCPTQLSVNNLYSEGFKQKSVDIALVGDVMFDATIYFGKLARPPEDFPVDSQFVLSTVHRAENTDDPKRLKDIVLSLNDIHNTVAPVIMPIHPRTRKAIHDQQLIPEFRIVEPFGYLEMMWMQKQASLILTDSGGVQKEAFFFGTPCLTLREETEWVELIDIGANKLVGANKNKIISAAKKRIGSDVPKDLTIYGAGDSSSKIAEAIKFIGNG